MIGAIVEPEAFASRFTLAPLIRTITDHARSGRLTRSARCDSIAINACIRARKEKPVTALTIRNIDPVIKEKLRTTAAAHGRSMEEEARVILRAVLSKPIAATGLGTRIHTRFAALGGVELPKVTRTARPRGADFAKGSVK